MAVPSPVPQSPWECLRDQPPRRRIFWTTQPEACGDYMLCGYECDIPGLIYTDGDDLPAGLEPGSRSIANHEWLRGLVLNILNTRARSDLKCPTPAGTYGHWSESYREDNLYIGARFWNAAEKSYVKINDSVKAIGEMIKADLHKLVQMGVAAAVEVKATYVGSGTVEVVTTVTSPVSGSIVLNLAGAFVASGWEWR
jgi:phage gp46-like protein